MQTQTAWQKNSLFLLQHIWFFTAVGVQQTPWKPLPGTSKPAELSEGDLNVLEECSITSAVREHSAAFFLPCCSLFPPFLFYFLGSSEWLKIDDAERKMMAGTGYNDGDNTSFYASDFSCTKRSGVFPDGCQSKLKEGWVEKTKDQVHTCLHVLGPP